MPWVIGFAVLAAVALVARTLSTSPASLTAAGKKRKKTLNEELREAAVFLVPSLSSTLRPGDAILDSVYGGRRPDMNGAPAWNYYQTLLDANGKKGGTTCGIVLSYLLAMAGWPKDMLNRAPTDPVPGSGFVPGNHISKAIAGAQKRGWYVTKPGTLQPGDGYHIDHPEKGPNHDHVGVVTAVAEPAADGTRKVTTLDGGQGPGAEVKQNVRTLSADGSTLTLAGVPARVVGVFRAGPDANA